MRGNKALLVTQSILCILTGAALIAADLSIYLEGSALKATDPMADIYSAEAVAERAVFILPLFIITVIVTIVCAVLGVRDKKADKPATGIDIKKNNPEDSIQGGALNVIRGVIVAAALLFIIAGILNGSMQDVLIKATKICTECIGLG